MKTPVRALLLATVFTSATTLVAQEDAPRPPEKGPVASADAKLKSFTIDSEAWEEGVPPKDLFVLDGTVKIAVKDGSKAILIEPNPIVDVGIQVGESAAGTTIAQVRVKASKRGRSSPRFGISVHGLTGRRLYVNCAKKQLELVHGETTIATAPFAWESDTWTLLHLSAVLSPEGKWTVTGKAWKEGTEEPKEPLVKEEQPQDQIKGNGKVTLWGTPFSEMPIYLDDVKVQVATKN
jgi:hypothetical protein